MKGFRQGTRMYDSVLAERVKGVVSREALGFLWVSFCGGLFGGVVGAIFAFGLGAFIF